MLNRKIILKPLRGAETTRPTDRRIGRAKQSFSRFRSPRRPYGLLAMVAGISAAVLVSGHLVTAANLNQAVNTLPQNEEWSIMAYAALGQNVGQSFLSQPLNSNIATDYEKRILAITAIGENPTNFGSENFIAKLESMFDGSQIGDPSLLNDDIFGILAFKSASAGDRAINASRQFILNNQNSNGGWGFAPGVGSDSNTTAMAIAALGITGGAPSNAFSYLQQSQDSSGGYGFSPGLAADGASTAWVISGLISAGQSVPANAKSFLENLQLPDGSFKWRPTDTSGSGLVTAYAIIALSGHGLPIRTISTPSPTLPPSVPLSPAPIPPTTTYPEHCLVPIYHTNFAFPPEGGNITTIDGKLYFVKTYESGCSDTPLSTPANYSLLITNYSLFDHCLVPIYHTNFAFPPEGGNITTIDEKLYFVKTYESGCSDTPLSTPANYSLLITNYSPSINLGIRYNSSTLFNNTVPYTGQTVLAALQQSEILTQVNQTGLGAFVYSIGGIAPAGTSGWQYAVNGTAPSVGADQYILHSGDRVQWFYGPPGTSPY